MSDREGGGGESVECDDDDDDTVCAHPACQIAGEDALRKYGEEPGLRCVVAEDDRKVSQEAVKAAEDTKLTWLQFSAFADLLANQRQSRQTDSAEGPLQTQRDLADQRTDSAEGQVTVNAERPPQTQRESQEDERRVIFIFLFFIFLSKRSWYPTLE